MKPLANPRCLVLLACAAALGCMAPPGKPGPSTGTPRPEQVLDFPTLYAQNCAACHGANGKNGAAIALNNPVYLAIAGSANIQRITADGVPGTAMPPFTRAKGGMLTEHQIAALATGMEQTWVNPTSLAGQTAPAYANSTPGDPAQGQKAFAAYCAQCHGADATGMKSATGVVTGSLIEPAYLALIGDQGLRSILLAGQTEQGAHDWRSYSSTHALTSQEAADIVAWLASHRIDTPGQVYRQHP
jgi:cytochrome c oxidase cbb3-type subunit 3/ubiquinol-cytochrome c reductase cytochrome c subunit